MIINTNVLKAELNSLSKIIEEYEDNYLNLRNCISSLSFFWQGINANKYIDKRLEEIKEIKITLNELENIKDTYQFIFNQYSMIGNNIELDLSFEKKLLSTIYDCRNTQERIITLYNDLNPRLDSRLNAFFEKEKNIVKNNLLMLRDIENKVKKTITDLIEIERKVKNKVSKIKIKPIID